MYLLKILINIDSVVKPPLTGIGYYTLNLLKELIKEDTDIYCIYHNKIIHIKDIDLGQLLNRSSSLSDKKISVIPKIKKLLRKVPYLYYIREWMRNINFQTQIEKYNLTNAVYIEPNYIVRKCNIKTISIIHDLSHIHYPDFHPKERVDFLKKMLPETINQTNHIITVSNFVRNEIIDVLNVPPDRVSVIWNGVSEQYKPYSRKISIPILAKYGLDYKQYILSVATLEPRKNINSLVDAYLRLEEKLQERYPLVLAGTNGWGNSELKHKINKLVKQGKIIDIGYVHDKYLPVIYSSASVFIYISHYEGFGLPVLEAMACGVPVITTKNSAMSEVTRDSAVCVDQNDQNEIKNAIQMLLKDGELAIKYTRLGLKRSIEFSWRKTASGVLNIIKSITPNQ
jgi:alpha-1,3-rhamnosyl/mannosyltransferase